MRRTAFNLTLSLLFLSGLTLSAYAQAPATTCPTISVTCPDTVEADKPLTFTASVVDADANLKLTYNWTISAGTIISGQGSPSVTIDTSGLPRMSITATVTVAGLNPDCTNSASCTTATICIFPPRRFDEYGRLNFEAEQTHLDNFAAQLKNELGSQGYIIAYAGRRARPREALSRLERVKKYLVDTYNFDNNRIVAIDGGHREEFTVVLWIVQQGTMPPTATPTVQPSEVEIITTPEKPSRRRRN
jgi:hypothetical protein